MTTEIAKKWLKDLENAEKTLLIQDNRLKFHYSFKNGMEMAEEYDKKSQILLERKIRLPKNVIGLAEQKWEYEIGEPPMMTKIDPDGLNVSVMQPIFVRQNTKNVFQWRVRNIPYPLDVYNCTVDDNKLGITLRTFNKKYFKKFSIPDLIRVGIILNQNCLKLAHANNTLIITYEKPSEYLNIEKSVFSILSKVKPISGDCLQS